MYSGGHSDSSKIGDYLEIFIKDCYYQKRVKKRVCMLLYDL